MAYNVSSIIGYSLLIAGIILISTGLYMAFSIMTGRTPPPDLFREDITFKSPLILPGGMKTEIEVGVLPKEVLNVGAGYALSLSFIAAGSAFGRIGAELTTWSREAKQAT